MVVQKQFSLIRKKKLFIDVVSFKNNKDIALLLLEQSTHVILQYARGHCLDGIRSQP